MAIAISGCAASLVARGAVAGAGLRAAAGLGARASLGGRLGAMAGARAGTGALARVPAGALRASLRQLTRGGRLSARLTIDRAGRIVHEGTELAVLERNGLITVRQAMGERFAVGRLSSGRIWEVTSKSDVAIGRVRGVSLGRQARVLAEPDGASPVVARLRSSSTVDILQVRDGWYEVRLASGATGWALAPMFGLFTELDTSAEGDSQEEARPRFLRVVLVTSQVLLASGFEGRGDSLHLELTPSGQEAVVDRRLIQSMEWVEEDVEANWSADSPKIWLTNRWEFVGQSCHRGSTRTILEAEPLGRVVLDSRLVAGARCEG